MIAALARFRALAKVGALEAAAYRAELVTWLLSTTMPLVMGAFFSALVAEAPIGRMGPREVPAYFVAAFAVRILTGCYASRQINLEIRDGTLAVRLMRPVHPLVAYLAETVGAYPLRLAVGVPVIALFAALYGGAGEGPLASRLGLFAISVTLAFALSVAVSFAVGALAFFTDQSDKIMDCYLAGLFVLSGYLVPLELFPRGLRGALDLLPFRYQIGLPVEILVGARSLEGEMILVAKQAAMVVAASVVALGVWSRGVRRFAVFGG